MEPPLHTASEWAFGSDAETGLDDPGLKFVPPVVLGIAAPIGVYFLT